MTSQNQPEPVTASVRIAATPAEVFPHLVDASLIARWIGTPVDIDPVPGGTFAVDIDRPFRGTYVSVEPPHRVAFTWGMPDSDELPPGSSTVEILLNADGAETAVELLHHGLPEVMQPDHLSGWVALLDVLSVNAGPAPTSR
jgi:uncharacterized protein YndB with AHSA1/START domain